MLRCSILNCNIINYDFVTYTHAVINLPVFTTFPSDKFNFLSNSLKNDAFMPTFSTLLDLLCFTIKYSFKLLLLGVENDFMPHEFIV